MSCLQTCRWKPWLAPHPVLSVLTTQELELGGVLSHHEPVWQLFRQSHHAHKGLGWQNLICVVCRFHQVLDRKHRHPILHELPLTSQTSPQAS